MAVLTNLKKQIKHDVVIMVGGPSIDAHGVYDWRQDFPDADYAVYSDGEQAFHDILCHHFRGSSINVLTTKNLLWIKNAAIQKAPAAYVRNAEYSPYLESKHLLLQMANDPDNQGKEMRMAYETSRGCPYTCSFCDWSSGLGPTTVKRKADYRAELEFIASLPIKTVHDSNANFGQWPVDVEIAEMIAEIFPPRGIKMQPPNLSKNKKDRAYKILEILMAAGVVDTGKFAVQDIHPEILANVDRPDIPWEEHKVYIRHLKTLFPDKPFHIEGIKGLPGQTRATWHNMIRESYLLGLRIEMYNWVMIPNSPAMYDPEYKQKFNLCTRKIKNNKHDIVSSSYSYNEMDLAYFNFTQLTYKMLAWLGVTIEEFDQFNTTIPVQWEKTHFFTILKSLYSHGSVDPNQCYNILKSVFADHWLSKKYFQQWQQFLDDESVIHQKHAAGTFLS
jgi:tRNA A37 methylthiotransferase MiaB